MTQVDSSQTSTKPMVSGRMQPSPAVRSRRVADEDLWLKLESKLAERDAHQHKLSLKERPRGWFDMIARSLGIRRDPRP